MIMVWFRPPRPGLRSLAFGPEKVFLILKSLPSEFLSLNYPSTMKAPPFLDLFLGFILKPLKYLFDFILISFRWFASANEAWHLVTFEARSLAPKEEMANENLDPIKLNAAYSLGLCRASSIGRAVDS